MTATLQQERKQDVNSKIPRICSRIRQRQRNNQWQKFSLTLMAMFWNLSIPCVAQETPLFTTSIMDYGPGTHRQSVCHLQAQLHNGTLDLRNALQGLQLRPVLFKGSLSSVFLPANAEAIPTHDNDPGIVVEILDQLADRAGFTWRTSYGLADFDRVPANATFDNVLEWSSKMYDISCTMWTQSVPRLSLGVAFPEGWFDASLVLVGNKESSNSDFNLWSFLEPFTFRVWGLIAFSILISALVYGTNYREILSLHHGIGLVTDFHPYHAWMERYETDDRLGRRPTENIFYAAIAFTGDNRYEPTSHNGRLFVFSMGFFFLLIGSAYTANLASFLVVQNQQRVSVDGVGDAVRRGKVLCMLGGGGGDGGGE